MSRTSTLLLVAVVVALGLAFAPAALAQDAGDAPENGTDAVPEDPGDENATDPGAPDGEDGDDEDADAGAPDENATDPGDADENASDGVPDDFELPEEANECAQAATGDVVCDTDGDGTFKDVDGDGDVDHADVIKFFKNLPAYEQNPELFDYTGDEDVDHGDVIGLFHAVAGV